jgi:CMP-N,N'-diacetyllegionaminic acid synthase
MSKVLAVIGARAGSKGLPGKNIKLLAGKPLLGWIIDASHNAQHVDRTVVSTDSEQYAEVARAYGAEVIMRPVELATDVSPEIEYVRHAVRTLYPEFDIVMRLHPTCPLQAPSDIDACIDLLLCPRYAQADSAMIVAEARQHPAKALKLEGEYLVSYIDGEDPAPHNRQNHTEAYFRANAVAYRPHAVWTDAVTHRILAHIIPRDRALDIDSELDFLVAEQLIKEHGSDSYPSQRVPELQRSL